MQPTPPPPSPPSTTHSPAIRLPLSPLCHPPFPLHRGPHDHPPPPTPSNWRAPEYVLYIHTHALMSVPVLLPALPLPPPPLQEWKRREKALGCREKKRRRLGRGAEGDRSHLSILSRSTYIHTHTYARAPPGTPTSNVVININGAAQYSPDLASLPTSLFVHLRSISLLGRTVPHPRPPLAGRSHAASSPCYGFRVLRWPYEGLPRWYAPNDRSRKGCSRHFLAKRTKHWMVSRNVTNFPTLSVYPMTRTFIGNRLFFEITLDINLKNPTNYIFVIYLS